jgi:hypothetical protein
MLCLGLEFGHALREHGEDMPLLDGVMEIEI